MTPEQRLDRAEKILVRMIKSGRRTRSEWRYKINSLIDAQIRHEAVWHIQHEAINEQLKEVATAQGKNEKTIADLAETQKLTERSIADLAETQKLTERSIVDLAETQKLTERSIVDLAETQKLTEKSVADLADSQKLTEKSIGDLTRSQRLTDQTLRAFIDSLRKDRNGNTSD